ncbi:MAG: 4Fe-4S binding protein [Thermodesulfobacteriota bacterium]
MKPMMPGIPTYLYYLAVIAVMIVSFVLFVKFPGRKKDLSSYKTIDLLQLRWIELLAKSRIFQASVRFFVAFLFILVILTGLFGVQDPARNLSTILTWTIWWIFLILFILCAAKMWCYFCPWDAIATWIDKLHLWKIKQSVFSLEREWPGQLRNIYVATFLFLVLTWLELGWGVTTRPAFSAYLALLMLFLTIFSMVLFDRKSFCRYACLVGRISGLYALISPLEVRPRDKSICMACKTKDCFKGNRKGYACPTYEYLGNMEKNTYCIMCMECLRSCPKGNATINLRPFGVDLLKVYQAHTDEAGLALIMLAMASFHGLTMTPVWFSLTDWLQRWLGVGYVAAFTIGMGASLMAVGLFYLLLMGTTWIMIQKTLPLTELLLKNAYALLPIALFYHLAHNVMHFAMEGGKIVSAISDPFGWGWNLFGTALRPVGSPISIYTVWYLQVLFIVIGHVWSLYVGHRVAVHLYGHQRSVKAEVPLVLAMITYSMMSLFLVAQPMEMRTSM